MGPSKMNGDLFIRYERKINNGTIDWNIQYNVRNLYRKHGNDDIPIYANPDFTVTIIRIPNEQQYFLIRL